MDFYLAKKKKKKGEKKWRLVYSLKMHFHDATREAKNSLNQPVSSNSGEPRSINRAEWPRELTIIF